MMAAAVLRDVTMMEVADVRPLTKSKWLEGPAVIWDVEPSVTSEIYEDLGVRELEEMETKQTTSTKPKINQKEKLEQTPVEQVHQMEALTTPEPAGLRAPAKSHPHSIKKCSCSRRILHTGGGKDHFTCLPDEIILCIFRWFERKTLTHCAKVCKRWRRLAYDDDLWRRVDLSEQTFQPGILGMVLQRGVTHAKLSRATISAPIFVDDTAELRMDSGGDDEEWTSLSNSNQLNLESLDLSGCIVDDPATLETILARAPSLRRLSLESCRLHGGQLVAMAHRFASLHVLDVSMCRLTETRCLVTLLAEAQQLHSLNMSWTNLSKADLKVIIPTLAPSLRQLNISGYREKLLDSDIEKLVTRCPDLEELDLSDSTLLTQTSITMIADHLTRLQHISLSRCYDIPFYAFLSLDVIDTLKALDVFGVLQPRDTERLKARMSKISINSFPFSSVARPTCNSKQPRHIWGERCDI